MAKIAFAGLERLRVPFPVLQELADSLPLSAVWQRKELKDQLDVKVNEVHTWSQVSPCSSFVILENTDAIFGSHPDQADRFGIGATLMHSFIMCSSWQPNDLVLVILHAWHVTSWFGIYPNRCAHQNALQSPFWNSKEHRKQCGLLGCGLVALLIQEASSPNLKDDIVQLFVNCRMKFGTVGATVGSFA